MKKVNLGCGDNRLVGWDNYDANVDITHPLPWGNNSIDFIFIEHCVEHVDYYSAIRFFKEARRVLVPGGVLRVVVPSIERIWKHGTDDYFQFTRKWGPTPDVRGAMHAILYAHGHKTAWTATLLEATLFYCGFDKVVPSLRGISDHAELQNTEGHHRIIGEKFNDIESIIFEASAHSVERRIDASPKSDRHQVAVIIGGAQTVWGEIEQAKRLCEEAGADPRFFFVNDMIAAFPDHGIAVSLHPEKIAAWLTKRASSNYPVPEKVWCHTRRQNQMYITHYNRSWDWSGSSGLFATKIAMDDEHFTKVLLCGIPMSVEQNHFVRKTRWIACTSFWRAWITHKADLVPYVRSFSGQTAELLGKPDLQFLNGG